MKLPDWLLMYEAQLPHFCGYFSYVKKTYITLVFSWNKFCFFFLKLKFDSIFGSAQFSKLNFFGFAQFFKLNIFFILLSFQN